MARWLPLLTLCMYACAALKMSCDPYPAAEYRDVCMECSGELVKEVPRLLPETLQMLLLTGTAIASLDGSSFQGRHLPELRTLYVTGGRLASVRAGAFCSLPALTMLHLEHNKLELLEESSFNCSQLLKTVSLVGNPNLRHLPRLFSSSVDHLYLDDCNLANIEVASVRGMTALEVLSLNGNPDLYCPSVISQFKQARPNLRVICEDSAGDIPSSLNPGERDIISEKSLTRAGYSITTTNKDSIDVKEHTTEKSLIEPDSTSKNEMNDSTADTESGISVTIGAIAAVLGVIIIIVVFYFVYRRRNSIPKRRSVDPDQEALRGRP